MAGGTKTLRGNTTIWAVRPEAFTDWSAPISAAKWATAVTAGLITDISQAVEDAYKLSATGSKTDNSRSVLDIALVDSPMYVQYQASLSLFRNRPGTTNTPVFDVALALFDNYGIPYFLVDRVDKTQSSAVAVGDILSAYGVETDQPRDQTADIAMLMFDATFKPVGGAYPNLTVVA
jgi:hypothetical protein